MLPCGTKYLGKVVRKNRRKQSIDLLTLLAPVDCLQYFTAISGKVSSFNWMDVAGTRQLNSQNYNICFRTELISSQVRITLLIQIPTEKKKCKLIIHDTIK